MTAAEQPSGSGLRVRPLRGEELVSAAVLVRSICQHDEVFNHADAIVEGRAGTVVGAFRGSDELIGVATLGPPASSSFRLFRVHVAAPVRRNGIGTALLDELRRRSEGAPLIGRLRPWDVASHGFSRACGLKVVEHAMSVELDPAVPRVARWIAATPLRTEAGAHMIEVDEPSLDEVASVLARWYRRTHPYAPLPPFPVDEARRRFVDPALDEAVVAIRRGQRMVAAGTLLADPFAGNPGIAHLAFAGTADPERDEITLVRMTYAACLRTAARLGRRVRMEVSDNHLAGWSVAASLPAVVRPELVMVAEPVRFRG